MFYHVSLVPVEKFVPRIPKTTYEQEDRTINRICVTTNIQKALQAAPQMGNILKAFLDNGIQPIVYIYTFDEKDFEKDEYKTPDEIVEYVADAIQNQEYWLLKEPKKYTCKKYYITDAWIKEFRDMFGITENFCINAHLKQTKSKKNNEELLLKHFKNSNEFDLIQAIMECDASFRGKMKYLLDNGYFGKENYYGNKNEEKK